MATTKLHFRAATASDAPAVAKLIQDGFRAPDSRTGWAGDLDALASGYTTTAEEQLKNINKPDTIVLVAEDSTGAAPVGTVTASKRQDDQGGHIWLSMLAVDTARQQGGLGRALLEYAEEYFVQTWRLREIGLNALSTRHALTSWYERRGYRRDGKITPFPVKDEQFKDMDLPEDLHFVTLRKRLPVDGKEASQN